MDDRSSNVVRVLDEYAVAAALEAGGGEALFVINLCAAMTPIAIDNGGLSGLESFKLYQVSRMEDGRRRYRLRLGFFTCEADAENVLVSVRARFATAFTSCLCDEDLRYASGYLKRPVHELQQDLDFQRTGRFTAVKPRATAPVARSAPPAAPTAGVKPASITVAVKPTAATFKPLVAKVVSPSVSPVATPKVAPAVTPKSAVAESEVFEVTWEPDAASRARPTKPVVSAPVAAKPVVKAQVVAPPPAPTAKAPVSAPVKPASAPAPTKISKPVAPAVLTASTLTASTPPATTTKRTVSDAAASRTPFHVGAGVNIPDVGLSLASDVTTARSASPAQQKPVVDKPAVRSAKPLSGWRQESGDSGAPALDTTQTIRALTKRELDDAQGLKWFVVQLAVSDQPVNLDTMPRLDIFEAYRLYSVAMMESAGIRHCLRLGFFSEAVSAEAVTGYLKTFFANPTIERISTAEHDRFLAPPPPKASSAPAQTESRPQARVITLEEKRAAVVPTVNQTVTTRHAPPRPAGKYAAPAVRNGPAVKAPVARKSAPVSRNSTQVRQHDLVSEARSLGLSDTQILRVKKNPSLLSRLVGKLTK
ncbi:MAG: hypothetical protein H7Y02_12220 [Candidatus Obscuribacterales bacterium]|nr:hypothetical protein [Steroidobacteraceae bacterium]